MTKWRVAVMVEGTVTSNEANGLLGRTEVMHVDQRDIQGRTEVLVTVNADDFLQATMVASWIALDSAIRQSAVGLQVARWEDYERSLTTKPDLVGAVEAAEILGVSRARVHQLAERPDFPQPLYELAAGKLWSRSEIEAFGRKPRRHGRPRKDEA